MKKQSIFSNPVRYFLVACCGFGIDFLIYAVLVSIGISIYPANVAGFIAGASVNVLLIRKYVFPESRFRLGMDLILTMASNGAMLGVGMVLLWILADVILFNPYLSKLIANAITFVLNYLTRKYFFRK